MPRRLDEGQTDRHSFRLADWWKALLKTTVRSINDGSSSGARGETLRAAVRRDRGPRLHPRLVRQTRLVPLP
jgi:hypothetical protein